MADDNLGSESAGISPEGNEDKPPLPEISDENARAFFCDPQPTSSPLRPGIRECDWTQFKNIAENDTLYVADALVAGSNLNLQVLDENIKRDKSSSAHGDKWIDHSLCFGKWIPSQHRWIHRIRIRSAAVLNLLNKVSGDAWDSSKAHTFMRPFGYLIHHQDAVKTELSVLERSSTAPDLPLELNKLKKPVKTDLQEIRSYVDFVDESLLPLYKQFENVQDGSKTVMFDDLWYLFRPGELVCADLFDNGEFETLRGPDAYISSKQGIWRVADICPYQDRVRYDIIFSESGARPYAKQDETNDRDMLWYTGPKPKEPERTAGWFTLSCYYLDFDGERYFPVWIGISIPPFSGERTIFSLGAYPIRFSGDPEKVYNDSILQGNKFLGCVEKKHMWYNGFFLMREPTGRMMQGRKGDLQDTFEFKGEVYIDVKEAMSHRIQWKFLSVACHPHEVESRISIEPYRIIVWSSSERKHIARSSYEIVVVNDDVDRFQFNKYLEIDPYISQDKGIPAKLFPHQQVDFALLPRRVFAYIFRDLGFMPVDVNYLEPLDSQPKAFDNVIFKEASKMKDQLNAVLDAYFERKRALARSTSTTPTDDIVWGKGAGLVILLQGAPGTGKTATVEAIAQSRGKPVMVITPEDTESDIGLNIIFNLAAKWDCIVLIDEVDVLMGRRIPNQLGANIWVSRLLRHLEEFTGVLFLTTMRPGVLDEGVKSRVHLNLCYQPLDEKQTTSIFKLHLDQLSRLEKLQHDACPSYQPLGILELEILNFAREHYKDNIKIGRWNGRQIRNAVRVAAAIAHFEYRDKPRLQPQLQPEHFRKVAELTKEYDRARQKAVGTTDYGLARQRAERCDIDTQKATLDAQIPPSQQYQMQPVNWDYPTEHESYQDGTLEGIDIGGYDYEPQSLPPNATQQLPISDGRRSRDVISGDGGKLGQGLMPRGPCGSVPSSPYSGRRLVGKGWERDD